MPPKKGTEAYDKWRNSEKYKLWIESRTGKNNPMFGTKRPDLIERNKKKNRDILIAGFYAILPIKIIQHMGF